MVISAANLPQRTRRTQSDNRQSRIYNELVDGLLIIDKPAGMTSHDVVARVRRIVGERRVGHTGTLDPFATGVLVVLVGRATRLAQYLSGAEKEYEAVIRLGYATDTGDVTGTRIEKEESESHAKAQSPQSIREEEIETALASLRGEIEQTPPMYSAKKIAGRKLYELARRGEEVERKPVRVTIKEFETFAHGGPLLTPNDDRSRDLRCASCALRELTFARWPKISDSTWGWARTWLHCAAHAPVDSRLPTRLRSND